MNIALSGVVFLVMFSIQICLGKGSKGGEDKGHHVIDKCSNEIK